MRKKTQSPTHRESIPMKNWKAMGKPCPSCEGMKMTTRKPSNKFGMPMMDFYYGNRNSRT